MQKAFSNFFGWLAVLVAGLGSFFMATWQFIAVVLFFVFLAKLTSRISYGYMSEGGAEKYLGLFPSPKPPNQREEETEYSLSTNAVINPKTSKMLKKLGGSDDQGLSLTRIVRSKRRRVPSGRKLT